MNKHKYCDSCCQPRPCCQQKPFCPEVKKLPPKKPCCQPRPCCHPRPCCQQNSPEAQFNSVLGYGYYSINMNKYSVADIKKEWEKIINLAKTFPGFIEGKLMFPTTPLNVDGGKKIGVFSANVVAYGQWKTKKDDYRWVEGALRNGWGFNKLHPTHKFHVTMIEK